MIVVGQQAEMGRIPVLSGGRAEYERLYKWSIEAPADFWAKVPHEAAPGIACDSDDSCLIGYCI
jgi:hypothetical protein